MDREIYADAKRGPQAFRVRVASHEQQLTDTFADLLNIMKCEHTYTYQQFWSSEIMLQLSIQSSISGWFHCEIGY
jgi:hypothetical protein